MEAKPLEGIPSQRLGKRDLRAIADATALLFIRGFQPTSYKINAPDKPNPCGLG